MAEARRRWLWRSWLPDVGAAFSRLRLAVLLAGFLTFLKLWADNPSEAELKILDTFAASVIAVDLFVESQGRSKRTRVMAWSLASQQLSSFPLPVASVVRCPASLCGVDPGRRPVGPSRERTRNASLWLFNHRSIGPCGSTPQAMGSTAWRLSTT